MANMCARIAAQVDTAYRVHSTVYTAYRRSRVTAYGICTAFHTTTPRSGVSVRVYNSAVGEAREITSHMHQAHMSSVAQLCASWASMRALAWVGLGAGSGVGFGFGLGSESGFRLGLGAGQGEGGRRD
jgi:hypothetical protein